jgi:two-component system, cell cycle sensor histidine kinase and response regulator CckA
MRSEPPPQPPHEPDLQRRLVALANDLLFTADLGGRLTFVNDAAGRSLQYSASELVGREALSLVRHDAREDAAGFYRRQLERGLSDTYYELPLVGRGQGLVWAGVHLRLVVVDGTPHHFEGAARDVTDRRRVEEALQQSDERYRQAFDENLAGIYVASPSGQIRSCNPAFVHICGFPSLADALGANLAALYPDNGMVTLVERVRRDGAVRQHETSMVRVDGRVVPVIESLVGRFDPQGELMSINGYVFDDSPRKDLEAQMRQAQKMEALGRLAGGVAHDFNNVLMVINGLSETVLAILEANSPVREDLEEILSAGRRAAGLTAQLLAFSRKRVLMPTTFDLDEAIAAMQPMLCRLLGADIALVVEPSSEPKWIVADRGQIEQVLLNLAANARDAMPEGGELRITANVELRAYEVGREMLSTPEVVLRLSDTGQGMSPDVLARLFEPYFTTKARGKGTGLGLSTVYAIVSESGGRITVESHRSVGTTFAIAIPLAVPPEFAIGGETHPAFPFGFDSDRATRTILVVEDEAPVRHLVTSTLQRAGYTVLSAEDAVSAMARFKGYGAPIDLLITDVIMPGRNGRELARDAEELQPGLRVLFMSGYADRTFGPEGPGGLGDAFLQKPFALDVLVARVRSILQGTPRAAAPDATSADPAAADAPGSPVEPRPSSRD